MKSLARSRSAAPVSYTHLDVYKRQVIYWWMFKISLCYILTTFCNSKQHFCWQNLPANILRINARGVSCRLRANNWYIVPMWKGYYVIILLFQADDAIVLRHSHYVFELFMMFQHNSQLVVSRYMCRKPCRP